MTVTQQASKVTYAGNGQQVEFFVPFVFYQPEDLDVLKIESDGSELLQVLNVDYAVYGGGRNGAVTMTAAPSNQERLVILCGICLWSSRSITAQTILFPPRLTNVGWTV
ncbi:hypothetical protein [Pelagibius sp. Alg239-R121]|uniref:hypothetical protein n=1 Tax=Pelagibius sp. Alg239-R121 TaxID=2993448 RepID=UPI0024A62D05|nr:hypothetical protein [Pelagibius sp. Alg239-R121]